METALAAAEESVELTQVLDESHISMYAGVILAIARMESGNPEQAAKLFVEAAGGEGLPHVPGGWRAKYLDLLTRCRIALGRIDEAERSAGFASAVATDTGLGTSIAWAERAGAAVRARPRRHGHGRRARTRVGRRRRGGRRDARCRGLAPPGRPRARPGRGARPRRRGAGAGGGRTRRLRRDRWRQEAERELRKLGRRVHRRTRPGKADGTGVETLSERELQLARLVVDRRTNPEIAAALFLSQKTVESHLRNMFRKLGVSSRVELARAVEQAERASAGIGRNLWPHESTLETDGFDRREGTGQHPATSEPRRRRSEDPSPLALVVALALATTTATAATPKVTSIRLVSDGGFVARHGVTAVDRRNPAALARTAALVPARLPRCRLSRTAAWIASSTRSRSCAAAAALEFRRYNGAPASLHRLLAALAKNGRHSGDHA